MPIHDWTRVPTGLFHDFHQIWSEPDVVAVETFGAADIPAPKTAVLEKPTAMAAPARIS